MKNINKKKDRGSKKLKEMYDSLSDFDKWRVYNYIYTEIQLPLIIDNLKKAGILDKNYRIKDRDSEK